jgi:thiol-disulfide isomerase/thioredoxin
LVSAGSTCAQTARVTVTITATGAYNGYIVLSDPLAFEERSLVLDPHNTATRVLSIRQPHNVQVSYQNATNYYSYNLFVSPGDDLRFTADIRKKQPVIVVTGTGSNNNQPKLAPLTDIYSVPAVSGNSPYAAMSLINKQQVANKIRLANYIRKYKPGAAFINICNYNLAYYAPVKYYFLQTRNLDPERQSGPWRHLQDSLFATISLNNDAALGSANYTNFLPYYLQRLTYNGYDEEHEHPVNFYRTWYHTDIVNGKKLFFAERKNLFVEKVLNRHFSGKTAEYLYANLLHQNLTNSRIENIDIIFTHFRQRYPGSPFIAALNDPIRQVTQRQSRQLNSKMLFLTNNGSRLNSFNDILALTKGKTVLIDMWGTWCSPCREEIEENSLPIREHFKGKNIAFMYVANFDEHNEAAWKKLIAYFDLEGTHILANKKLTDDIMKKVKGTGYPTYILIKKDGTYGLAKNQYRVNRAAMIKELEAAL